METRVERIELKTGCAEKCTVIFNGQEFTALGASLWEDANGKLRGVLYAPCDKGECVLKNFDGSIRIPAEIGSTWEGNFLDYHGRPQQNRSYYVTIKGRRCRGVNYNRQWSQIVRIKEL